MAQLGYPFFMDPYLDLMNFNMMSFHPKNLSPTSPLRIIALTHTILPWKQDNFSCQSPWYQTLKFPSLPPELNPPFRRLSRGRKKMKGRWTGWITVVWSLYTMNVRAILGDGEAVSRNLTQYIINRGAQKIDFKGKNRRTVSLNLASDESDSQYLRLGSYSFLFLFFFLFFDEVIN